MAILAQTKQGLANVADPYYWIRITAIAPFDSEEAVFTKANAGEYGSVDYIKTNDP